MVSSVRLDGGDPAYHLADSEWRWAFAALSVGGIATIGGIFWIRSYIDGLTGASKKGNER
jgi:hypothetical protein